MIVDRALIIAAGRGIRFGAATRLRPKPLIEAAGMPLISRAILALRNAGVNKVTVVTGYRGKALEKFLDRELPWTRCLHNPQWRLPNGYSVLRAKGEIREPFVLLMADHLFDPAILRRLSASPLSPGRCRLAVDDHPEKVPDLDDATKVEVRDEMVCRIGKAISNYNAVDTGIFLCTEAIFSALEEATEKGKGSLSEGIQILADSGRMEATAIGSLFWRDIDDERALKEAEEKLKTVSTFKLQVSSSKQNL